MFSSERITDATNSSSQAQSRLLPCVAVALPGERLRDVLDKSALYSIGTLLSKRNIRCSLCPDPCRAIVPCELIPGQTQPLPHEPSGCGSTVTSSGVKFRS